MRISGDTGEKQSAFVCRSVADVDQANVGRQRRDEDVGHGRDRRSGGDEPKLGQPVAHDVGRIGLSDGVRPDAEKSLPSFGAGDHPSLISQLCSGHVQATGKAMGCSNDDAKRTLCENLGRECLLAIIGQCVGRDIGQ
jgi:hypothetical protein